MKVVMLGEHLTGKSTYLVGLFGGLSNSTFDEIALKEVHDSVHFLNEGLKRLARRESVERSAAEGAESVALTVVLEGVDHLVSIPDRSGEALKGSINGRDWHAELLAELEVADALLLFVNPMTLVPGEPAEEVRALVGGEDAEGDGVPWQPSLMPTDVRLIDALQELAELKGGQPIPVAVIISAWDEVHGLTPGEWLAKRLPLVAQFLESNAHRFPFELFGVSVQGARFEDPSEVDPSEPDPWDRAWAVDSNGSDIDLCSPLVWLLKRRAPE
jgi:hypothetical protein